MFNKETFKENIKNVLLSRGTSLENATEKEIYYAVSRSIVMSFLDKWKEKKSEKRVSYFSAEFLMGRAFSNNLINLNILDEVKSSLKELNININLIEDEENDAGLGNGGLGRLAACFLDSAATHDIPLDGYGIKYEYGLFKQYFEDGFQKEVADDWTKDGDAWSVRYEEDKVIIDFADFSVYAVPYDMMIIGYDSSSINTLRLWKAESMEEFDFELFNEQKYLEAQKNKILVEDISRVLYPNDDTEDGKILRIRQQYFFSSASLKYLVKRHKEKFNTLDNFYKYNKVQLNDTHPAVSIPEFIRILVDEEG